LPNLFGNIFSDLPIILSYSFNNQIFTENNKSVTPPWSLVGWGVDKKLIKGGCSVYAAYTQRRPSEDAASLYRYAASSLGNSWMVTGSRLGYTGIINL
jgi:hypothetical protein